MDKIRIRGGRRLEGVLAVSGAKNAILPAMAASLLTPEPVVLENTPAVRDVATMIRVLQRMGATDPVREDGRMVLRVPELRSPVAPYDLVKTMRASVLVLGPLLARCGEARVSLPGGCAIGARPVNLHLAALEKLGARLRVEHGYILAEGRDLRGAEITFDPKTVTGTENVMMAATRARGLTVVKNAAREPEIEDLAALLNAMGARIEGAGSDTIRIEGGAALHGAMHRVIPDRIEAGTFVMAAAITRGGVRVEHCRPAHLETVLEKLQEIGVKMKTGDDFVEVLPDGELRAADLVTSPYPAFPTDLQAQYMALVTQARGTSRITESIFENRLMHVGELRRMGADIGVEGRSALVRGGTRLAGAEVMATDLRASACLIVAGLVADGETTIDRAYHIDRGYERIEEKLRRVGADVERIR
ncbi:MAG TPA: UDP-N-acetylglucosamine 1-carboxyvinyltransferase [Candidatus Polarisedimenticolia bacterium]|jgi:UDP-N-acetylglucosamine 1-carboxyvinyltransferase|nr:UDP-N-acetylglucosamine 1-carboxyvinyltransferase [Candidatus Polarisedimenticolia bacterium]